MGISPFDSAIFRDLLCDIEIAQAFDDSASIDSWLRVEAALAGAQGELGIIPAASADAIQRLCADAAIDAASLAADSAVDGIPIPALLKRLHELIDAPGHGAYLHFGATTQDIMDSGLVLRLRQVCDIVEARISLLLSALADLAEAHAQLPLVARTRRQAATPTSFGAVVASWGAPLLSHLEALEQLRPRLLRISLAGASGNSTALAEQAAELRALVATKLDLEVHHQCWHSDRSALAEFASLMTRICGALAKIGEDCMLGSQQEVGEIGLAGAGGSSTMPHKQNPVQAEILLSLFGIAAAQETAMTQALLHRQQRDAAAWMLEWHALPQICMATGRALQLAISLATGIEVDATRMLANLEGAHGLVYAEAISFRLAETMPRPQAQARVKQLCSDALAQACRLSELVEREFPEIDWNELLTPQQQLGDAATQARNFARRVREL